MSFSRVYLNRLMKVKITTVYCHELHFSFTENAGINILLPNTFPTISYCITIGKSFNKQKNLHTVCIVTYHSFELIMSLSNY